MIVDGDAVVASCQSAASAAMGRQRPVPPRTVVSREAMALRRWHGASIVLWVGCPTGYSRRATRTKNMLYKNPP